MGAKSAQDRIARAIGSVAEKIGIVVRAPVTNVVGEIWQAIEALDLCRDLVELPEIIARRTRAAAALGIGRLRHTGVRLKLGRRRRRRYRRDRWRRRHVDPPRRPAKLAPISTILTAYGCMLQ
jgi:hypothetical protein